MCIEIEDNNAEMVLPKLLGRKVVAITREKDIPGNGFHDGENSMVITFDDGSKLDLSGWGYDASGLSAHYTPGPANASVGAEPSTPEAR